MFFKLNNTIFYLTIPAILVGCMLISCNGVPAEDEFPPDHVLNDFARYSYKPLDPECQIVSFTVDPPYANRGSEFTFTWATENAKSVDLEPGLGTDLPRTGSLTVSLYESNWIRLVVRGPGGPVEEKLWVEAAWPGGSTWWKEYANQSNSGYSPYDGPATGHLYWTRTLEEENISSLLIGEDGSLIVFTAYSIHCLSPQGYTKWVYSDLDYILAGVINPAGDVYAVGGQNGRTVLKKIHPNGTEIWEYQFEDFHFISCLLNIQPQGTVSVWAVETYGCGSYASEAFIVDETGTLLTHFDYHYWTYTPSILLGTYFVGASSFLSCLNFEGYELWQNHDYYSYDYTVTTPDGKIYASTSTTDDAHATLSAFNAEGNVIWSYSISDESTFLNLIAAGNLGNPYFIATNHFLDWSSLISLDPAGNLRWQYALQYRSGFNVNSLAVDQSGTVYLVQRNKVEAINQGNLLWEYEYEESYYYPLCCLSMDGTLYIAPQSNQLLAFRDKMEDENP